MLRVVDASIVAKWFLPEEHKDKAEQILRDFLDDRVELAAPDLLIAEFGNVLWKRSTQRTKDISPAQADQIYEDFLALRVPLRHSPSIAEAALKLATQRNHPIYDMLYIALAEQSACEFVTADEKLINKFDKTFACLRWVGDL
jgi:predicted nucleic acid-binding protein